MIAGDESEQEAQLPHRDPATRYALLVNLCYVSRGMGARKVSKSKSDLQGHSRALAMVPYDRQHTISY